MSIADYIQEIKDSSTIERVPTRVKGGQQVGISMPKYRLTCDSLDITIECGYFRQHHKNRELLKLMLDSAINEIIK